MPLLFFCHFHLFHPFPFPLTPKAGSAQSCCDRGCAFGRGEEQGRIFPLKKDRMFQLSITAVPFPPEWIIRHKLAAASVCCSAQPRHHSWCPDKERAWPEDWIQNASKHYPTNHAKKIPLRKCISWAWLWWIISTRAHPFATRTPNGTNQNQFKNSSSWSVLVKEEHILYQQWNICSWCF